MADKNKSPSYREWESKLTPELKKELLTLAKEAKRIREKYKIRVFLVNRELKKKGKRTLKPNIKREQLKRKAQNGRTGR